MACCNDDAAVGLMMAHGQLCCRCCGKPEVYNVEAHAEQRAANHTSHHLARDACIAPHHNEWTTACLHILADKCGVCRSEFYYVKWIKRIAGSTADSTAYA